MSEPERQRYAGFWRRLLAFVIDNLLFSALGLLFLYSVYGSAFLRGDVRLDEHRGYYGLSELLVDWLLPLLLTVFFWVRLEGTPGKLLLGCLVVDARSGARLSVGQAVVRYLAYLVSALPLGLGFLWIMWDRRKQGFHDKIAKTVVVLEDESQKSLAQLEQELR